MGVFTRSTEKYAAGKAAVASKEARVAASVIGAGLGMLALALVHLISEINEHFGAAITLNKGIGPYSGKMVIAAIIWLSSWAILRSTLKNSLNMKNVLYIFIMLAVLSTIILFPPFIWLFH